MSCFSRLCLKENEYEKRNEITRPNHRLTRKENESKSGIKIHTSNCNSLNYNSHNLSEKQFADGSNNHLYFANPPLLDNQGKQLSFKEFEQMMKHHYSYYLASQSLNDNIANRPCSTQSSSNKFQLFKRDNQRNQRQIENELNPEEESKADSKFSQPEGLDIPSEIGKKVKKRSQSKNDKASKNSMQVKVSNTSSKSKSKQSKSIRKNKKREQTPTSKSGSATSSENCSKDDDIIDLDDYGKELKSHQKASKRGRNHPKAPTEYSLSNINNTSMSTTKVYQDLYSCTVCENIYSNSIYYGTPIKTTFQCSYCHNFLNENSLRFYEMKYARIINQTSYTNDMSSNICPTNLFTQPSQISQYAPNYYNMAQSNACNGYNFVNQTFHQNPSNNRNANKVSYTPGFSNQSNQNPSFMTNYSSVESLQYHQDGVNRQPYKNPNDMDSFLHHTYDVVSKQSVQVGQLNNKKEKVQPQSRNKTDTRKAEECSQVNYNVYQLKPLQTPACSEPSLSEFEEEMLETSNHIENEVEEDEAEVIEEIKRPPKEDCLLVFKNDNYEKPVASKIKSETTKSKIKKNSAPVQPKKQEKKNKDLSPIQDRLEDEDHNIDCLVLKDINNNNGDKPTSLAEIFKNKKKKLIEKIENREFDREELNEKYKVNLNVQRNNNQSDLYSSENHSSTTNKIKDPPIELLDRLRKGEKVRVSNS